MINFDKEILENKWIIGVSGGSDSMALLDMCYAAKIDIIAAHMNYLKRESADRDMQIVETYCKERNIPCHISFQREECTHNFQAFAREKRYHFYYELIKKYNAKGVLLAHQLDDVLETYLMQEHRHSIPEYYGIKETNTIMNCYVKRPLLEYTKQDLVCYCKEYDISYGEDESNYSRIYTRNRIRMDHINKMTYDEKLKLLEEIKCLNQEKETKQHQIIELYQLWNGEIAFLWELPLHQQEALIDMMIYETLHEHVSKKEITQIRSQLSHKHFRRKLHDYYIQSAYGKVMIVQEETKYSYVLEAISYLKTPYFAICDHGEVIQGITLKECDFPLTIRNVEKEDKIKLRFGTKNIHRWFIDRKIPINERKMWPVVENAQGNIIFVPKIGCDIEHFSNNPTLFVIK